MSAREFQRVSVLGCVAIGVLAAASCGAEGRDVDAEDETMAALARSGAVDAEEFFAELEDRLLRRPESRTDFHITAEGAFTADLEGKLYLGSQNEVTLNSQGTFGSDPVSLSLRVVDGQLIGGNAGRTFEEPVPAELREAIVLGLTRMGLLHNLARLVSGSPPDRAHGGVASWVRGSGFGWTARDSAPDRRGLSFQVVVTEQPTAEAVLWIDARGLPVVREQTVRFPDGEMRVREQYEIR